MLAQLAALEVEKEERLRGNPLQWIRHPRDGIVPLAPWRKQWEFIHAARNCEKIFTWIGPNRPGKSVAADIIGAEALLGIPIEHWPNLPQRLEAHHLGPPQQVGFITISKQKSRDQQQKGLGELIPARLIKGRGWNARTGFGGDNPKIELVNGSVGHFLSELQRDQTFESYAWNLALIDEAVAEWIMERLVARLVDAGGKLGITSVGELAWLNRLARKHVVKMGSPPARAGFVISVLGTTMRDNERLTEADINAAIEMYGGVSSKAARMRVLGEDVLAEGVVLDQFSQRNIGEDRQPPREWTWYEFADDGYANPFAWGFVAVGPGNKKEMVREIYIRRERPEQIAQRVLAIRKELGYREPQMPCVIDPAAYTDNFKGKSLISVADELRANGVKTQPGLTGSGSVARHNAMINFELGRGDIVIQPRCENMIFEIEHYREEEPDEDTGEHLGDRERAVEAHNHLVRGLGYLLSRKPVYIPPAQKAPRPGTPAADLAADRAAAARRAASPWRR